MDKIGQIAGSEGTLIITGVGPTTGFKSRCLVCRVDDTVIAAMTVNGNSVTTGITKYFPTGTKLYKGEIITLDDSEVITSITLTNATDSLTVVKCLE